MRTSIFGIKELIGIIYGIGLMTNVQTDLQKTLWVYKRIYMAKTITIYVQLNDATLQGRRSLRLSGSTCRLGIVPKDLMRNTLSNPKLNEQLLDKYSFYMLLSDRQRWCL